MVSTVLKVSGSLLCAMVVAAFFTGIAFGQAADGNLVGTILDSTGAVIPGAMVEVENVATGVKGATMSDETGFYRFNNLLVGTYKVTAGRTGLASASREVTVELNKTATANLALTVGGVTEDVIVSETTALIDTTTAQVANTYSTRLVADLPLAANPVAGGVYNLSLTGAGVASSGGVGSGFGPSVGGQRPRNNNFTVEGTDNNRKDVTGTVVDVPVDAIKEFSVLQNQFSAEFGHSSGGQFNVVLLGGTNEVHGAFYEYFQNRKLNAIDESAKRQATGPVTKPRFDQNFVGGQLGGPIIKNKFFYFGNFDYNPLGQQSTPPGIRRAPTTEGFAMLSAIPGLSQTNLGVLKKYVSPALAATETTEVTGSDGMARNVPLGTLPIVAPNYQNEYRWVGSADFVMSDRDQWRGRYIGNRIDSLDTANGATNLPNFFLPRPVRQMLISVSQLHFFTPSLANELRLAFNRYTSVTSSGDFEFPGLDVFPNLQIREDLNLQIGPNPNSPQAIKQNTYQLSENLSWFRARHDLKFGFDGRNLIACSCPPFIQKVRGDYNYTTLDRFLQDLTPNVLAQRNVVGPIGGNYNGNSYQLFFYANDNWKVSRGLTLNLGLRYEYSSVPTSMKEFDLNAIADVPGIITFRAPKAQKKNFAPRIGFAYSPGSSGTTSIRGGFGIAYDLIFDNVGINTRPPQATSTVDKTDGTNTTRGFLASGGIRPDAASPGSTPETARDATSGYLPDQKLGYSINWNLGVQRTFAKDYTADIRYLGNRGVHLLFQTQLNRNAIVTPTRNLPLFFSAPAQSVLDALPLTLEQLNAERFTAAGNPLLPYGFPLTITSYAPLGNSEYHGLAIDVSKRYSNHLLFKAAYTWSHLMDDSTAEINSTTLSPRRPEDFKNIRKEWASSLLDRRHRASFAWQYETPWFEKHSNPFLQKVVGNWQFSGAWIYESPEFVTPQSGLDANLNGDAAADRVVINSTGNRALSSDITDLKSFRNGTDQVVAYLVNNPDAYYIRARQGVYTTSGRNILKTRPIDNFDLSVAKTVPFKDRYQVQFRVDMFNAFNHPQYTPGRPNRVSAFAHAGETNYLTPGNVEFARWDKNMPSNARQLQLTAKFKF
jgi:hypothetical protein